MVLLVGDDAAFEHEGEGVEGGLPADGPSLSAAAGGIEGSQGEVEALQGGLVGREVAAGSDGSAEPGVERLDGVGAEDDLADLDLEGEERRELGPGVLP